MESSNNSSADQYLQKGIQEYLQDHFENASSNWREAYSLYQENKNLFGQLQVLYHFGLAYDLKGYHETARDYYKQSLVIAQQIKNQENEFNLLQAIGLTFASEENYDQAIFYFDQALKISSVLQSAPVVFELYSNLGNCYFCKSCYTECIVSYTKALTLRPQLDNPNSDKVLFVLLRLGLVYLQQGLYEEALLTYQEALSVARHLQDRQFECATLTQIAQVYICQGNYDLAIPVAKDGLSISMQLDDLATSLNFQSQLGYAYYWLNDYALAIEAYQAGLEISQTLALKDREASFLNQLGEAFYYVRETDLALENYNAGLEIACQINSDFERLNALHGIAKAECYLGLFEAAQTHFEETLRLAQELQVANMEANALDGMGLIFSAQGNYSQAITRYQESLEIYRRIENRHNEAATLDNIGRVYSQMGSPSQAISYHEQSLAIIRPTNEIYSEARSLRLLGYSQYKLGYLDEAAEHLFGSIHCLELIRENLKHRDNYLVSIFDDHTSSYRLLQRILIERGQTEAALEIAERGRARAFVELLMNQFSETEISNFTTEQLQINEIRQVAIDHNATVVEYSILQDIDEDLYIWVIQPTGNIHFRHVTVAPLEQKGELLQDWIKQARRFLNTDTRDILTQPEDQTIPQQVDRALTRLYELLIQPIADILPTACNETIYFAPVGQLFLVPFAALRDTKGQYLIQKYPIAITPSIQVLQLTHQKKRQLVQSDEKKVLVVGNPVMPAVPLAAAGTLQQLNPLPASEKEALTIADLLGTKALVGAQADKAEVLKLIGKAWIVHLATHGLFDEVQALNSAIALTPTADDNGLLRAMDILKLNLQAELVVLSACNTGQGRITGDGVIGLSRALIAAGTPSVVVSLWSVPDDSTAQLMVVFYQHWLKGSTKAQALRQAMVNLLNQYPEPTYWAAFVLVGENF
ncbi:MAG: CHAT domain-containing tetratricopeptide repeat protein [Thermosynechococcaceae cyanobacterium]